MRNILLIAFLMIFANSALASLNMTWQEIKNNPQLKGNFPLIADGVTLDQMCMLSEGNTLESIQPIKICLKEKHSGRRGFKCIKEGTKYVRVSNRGYENHPTGRAHYQKKRVEIFISEKYKEIDVYENFRGGFKVYVDTIPYEIPNCNMVRKQPETI